MTARGDLPARFHGLWRRRSIALDGGAPAEPALVLWWQGPEQFVDVRWRLDEPSGGDPAGLSVDRLMAGVTTYDPAGFLTWHHDLDSHAGTGADRSAVRWRGDDLVEDGRLPGDPEQRFEEVWCRVGADVPEVTGGTEDGAEVRTARAGRWSVTVRMPAGGAAPGRVRLECRNPVSGWVAEGDLAVVGDEG